MALSRRKFLLGSAVVSATWLTWSGVPAWGLAPAPAAAQFMTLSGLLVNHRLDPATGSRIAAFAASKYPNYAELAAAIIALAQRKQATQVEDFFADLPDGPLQEFAHWVILAWYSGCSSAAKDATVFTYEEALTFKTTADASAMPSYGFSGPNQWGRPLVPLTPMPTF